MYFYCYLYKKRFRLYVVSESAYQDKYTFDFINISSNQLFQRFNIITTPNLILLTTSNDVY